MFQNIAISGNLKMFMLFGCTFPQLHQFATASLRNLAAHRSYESSEIGTCLVQGRHRLAPDGLFYLQLLTACSRKQPNG